MAHAGTVRGGVKQTQYSIVTPWASTFLLGSHTSLNTIHTHPPTLTLTHPPTLTPSPTHLHILTHTHSLTLTLTHSPTLTPSLTHPPSHSHSHPPTHPYTWQPLIHHITCPQYLSLGIPQCTDDVAQSKETTVDVDRLLESLPLVPCAANTLTASQIHKVKLGGDPVMLMAAHRVTLAGCRLFPT